MDPTISTNNTESTPTNETGQPNNQDCSPILTLYFLAIIVALIGLAGNSIVLWLLGFRMRRKAISVYILNLALADSLFLCCHFVDSLLGVIAFYDFYDNNLSKEILNYSAIIPYISGLSILSAISTERCLSVLWPIWYRCRRPRNMSAIICAIIWTLSFLVGILDWYFFRFLSEVHHHHLWKNVNFIVTAFLFFLFMLLFGSSLALLVRVLCGSRRNRLTRLYVTISLTVMVFLICGLPLGIYWFLLFWFQIHSYHPFCYLHQVTSVLSCVNSCANPIIYFFVGSFRQCRHRSLKRVLQRALEDAPEEDECTDSHLQKTTEMSGSREW